MNRHMVLGAVLLLAPALHAPAAEAARCTLSKSAAQVRFLERTLTGAEKAGGRAAAGEIAALRSRLGDLARRGSAFAAKAAPIEAECRALTEVFKRLKPLREKYKAAKKTFNAKMKGIKAEYQVSLRRKRAMDAEKARMGCRGKLPKAKYERCKAWLSDFNSRVAAHNAKRAARLRRAKQYKNSFQVVFREYRKARDAASARFKKYKAALKAYRAERKAWTAELRQVWAKANAVVRRAYRARAKARREAAARKARLEMAQKLRGQVKGIQEALRRLSRSMQGDAAERKQWERATNRAMENAWNRGKSMIVDESLGVLAKRMDTQLSSADKQIRRAVDQLAGTKDPQRRERLHAAIKLMNKQREEIRRAKNLVVDRLSDAKKITDAVDFANSNPGDLEKSLRGTYELVKTTLGDPKVQKVLKIGKKFGKGAGYAQSIVDSAYDISTEVVSWKRINQLNRNSEAYLKAVNRLKGKMESKMKRIHELEGKK